MKSLGIFALILATGFSLIHSSDSEEHRAKQGPPPPQEQALQGDTWVPEADVANVAAYLEGVARAEWIAGVQRAEEEARQAAAAEAARVQAASQARSSQQYHPGSTVGECTGFAIPDYIIMRESGGNPSAYNPSGAYGCAQTLLSHYSSGSCRGLDPYTIEGQRECVNILSNGGTNLNPWAATR